MVQGVGRAFVANVSDQDDFLLARGPGDGAGAGVVLAGSGTAGGPGITNEALNFLASSTLPAVAATSAHADATIAWPCSGTSLREARPRST